MIIEYCRAVLNYQGYRGLEPIYDREGRLTSAHGHLTALDVSMLIPRLFEVRATEHSSAVVETFAKMAAWEFREFTMELTEQPKLWDIDVSAGCKVDAFAKVEEMLEVRRAEVRGERQPSPAVWRQLWDRLVCLIRPDLEQLYARLNAETEALRKALPRPPQVIWERNTPRFRVRVSECCWGDPEIGDRQDLDDSALVLLGPAILDGSKYLTTFSAEIYSKEQGKYLTEETVDLCVVETNDKTYSGWRKDILHFAITEAKALLKGSKA